jgi:hypothetical protein
VPQHHPRSVGRRLADRAIQDLEVRAADADGQRADQQVAARAGRLGDLLQPGAACFAWFDGDGAHVDQEL